MNTYLNIFILCFTVFLISCSEDDSPSRVTIGTSGNVLVLNDLQYQLPYVVQVTDENGLPKVGVNVEIKVTPITYNKGTFGIVSFINEDGDTSLSLDFAINATCVSEDTNNNGILDTGEDTNGNGLLDPSNIAIISPHPTETPTLITQTNTLVTGDSGFAYFALTYPKSEAFWSSAELTATASDGPPGNTQFVSVVYPYSETDFSNLPSDAIFTGPYGSASICTDPS
jgi:hypothetical protein